MRKDIHQALAHILPKSCNKYCGKKRGGTGWKCINPTGLKVAQERPIFKVSSPGSYALCWIDSQSNSNFYLVSKDEDW